MRSFLSQINPAYYILLSPAIFFAFLTIGKTKLFWYLYPLLPILAILISVTYVYVAKIRKPIIVSFIAQFLLVCIVLEAFIRSFIPHSYGYRASISLPEKVRVAWCISQLPGKDVAYMVNNDERDIAHLLEAAQLQIHSSFVYGGTPVTLYYSGKRIDYFYKKEEFVKVADTYPIFVISRYDLAHDVPIVVLSQSLAYKQVCSSKDWVVYSVL
jgi:hypothetical protein